MPLKHAKNIFQVSFIIPPEIIPGRMTLIVTLFLVLIDIFDTVTSQTPTAETMTSISTWLIGIFYFQI